MKEIKFKFWNTIDKCYVKNNWWNGNQDLNEVFIEMQNKYNIIPLLYTWLKDCHWLEIYEWDIVWEWYKYDDWNYKYWIFEVKYEFWNHNLINWWENHWEIIWNIYENPEFFNHLW